MIDEAREHVVATRARAVLALSRGRGGRLAAQVRSPRVCVERCGVA